MTAETFPEWMFKPGYDPMAFGDWAEALDYATQRARRSRQRQRLSSSDDGWSWNVETAGAVDALAGS